MYNPIRWFFREFAAVLGRWGVIDTVRGERTADLAWPRMVTGFARTVNTVADFAMVGAVMNAPALAGMAFALAYWRLSNTLALGVSGGTISLVSRRFGAGDVAGIDLSIKQSLWVGAVLAVGFTLTFVSVAEPLIALVGASPAAVRYGGAYLQVLGISVAFHYFTRIASRALVGADDAWTPMVIRGSGAAANIALNAVFIFGFGLGVVGAALGTVLASALGAIAFGVALGRGRLPLVGDVPIRLSLRGPYFDRPLMAELLGIVTPLVLRRIAQVAATFLLLGILATFGSAVVAAYEVSRRIRRLMGSPNWGFTLASSSLVGQSIGAGEPEEAWSYGWDIMAFSVAIHVLSGALAFAFARPIAGVFIDDPDTLALTANFVRVGAFGLVGFGIEGVATGVLRGSGETRWPFYAKFVGLYAVTIPIAYLGVVTPLGITAIYAAYLLETTVPALVTVYRVNTGEWLARHRQSGAVETD